MSEEAAAPAATIPMLFAAMGEAAAASGSTITVTAAPPAAPPAEPMKRCTVKSGTWRCKHWFPESDTRKTCPSCRKLRKKGNAKWLSKPENRKKRKNSAMDMEQEQELLGDIWKGVKPAGSKLAMTLSKGHRRVLLYFCIFVLYCMNTKNTTGR